MYLLLVVVGENTNNSGIAIYLSIRNAVVGVYTNLCLRQQPPHHIYLSIRNAVVGVCTN